MMKTTKRLFTCLAAAFAAITMHAYDFSQGGVFYDITIAATNNTPGAVSVVSGNGYSGTVTIPATVQNGGSTYNVTAIEAEAFANSIHLTGVSIGSNVTTIGYQAFYGCEELEEIVIPDNVTNIGYHGGYSSRPSETFVGCKALKTASLGSITSMGMGMFQDCTNLTTVTIGEGCTVIGNNCFSGCTKIKTVVIPKSVENIGNQAFQGCTALTSATVGDGA